MRKVIVVLVGLMGMLGTSCDLLDEDDSDGNIAGSANCDETGGDELLELECEVFDLVNQYRAAGADCGAAGSFSPTHALLWHETLTQAARLHSLDMGENGFFDHVNPDGEAPWDRVEALGYTNWALIGENIAAGDSTAEGVMNGWMNSDGHCANIMDPNFTQIGVGLAEVPSSDYVYYWTQVFATPQ